MFLYLDPGSGSFLVQLLIASLAGLGLFLGSRWARLKRLFKKKEEAKPEDEDEE